MLNLKAQTTGSYLTFRESLYKNLAFMHFDIVLMRWRLTSSMLGWIKTQKIKSCRTLKNAKKKIMNEKALCRKKSTWQKIHLTTPSKQKIRLVLNFSQSLSAVNETSSLRAEFGYIQLHFN